MNADSMEHDTQDQLVVVLSKRTSQLPEIVQKGQQLDDTNYRASDSVLHLILLLDHDGQR